MHSTKYSNSPATCASCAVRHLTAYAASSADYPAKIQAIRKDVRKVAARRTILRAGHASEEIFTLVRGWAFRFVMMPDGGRQILSFLFPGDLIALPLLGTDRLSYSVKAVTDVTLCVFPRADLISYIGSNPKLRAHLIDTWTGASTAADERLRDLGRCAADQRVARFILSVYAQLCLRGQVENLRFIMPLRQYHIADALGLTTIHVNRVLSELRRQGLYDITGDTLTILDLPGLHGVAEFHESETVP